MWKLLYVLEKYLESCDVMYHDDKENVKEEKI